MTAHDTARPGGEFPLGGDLTINRLGFGAMRLARGGLHGPARDRGDGLAVLRRAVELGVNHIDTAWFYRAGDVAANDLIREALSPYPENLVIATKVGPLLGPSGSPEGSPTRAGLRELVEQNLIEPRPGPARPRLPADRRPERSVGRVDRRTLRGAGRACATKG